MVKVTDERLLGLLARVDINGWETSLATRAGLSLFELEVVLGFLESVHAVRRVEIDGERHVSSTIEMGRARQGLDDVAGFHVLRLHQVEDPTAAEAPLAEWPAVREALEIFRAASPLERSLPIDDQIEWVDDAAIERAQEAGMVAPEANEPIDFGPWVGDFGWSDLSGCKGELEEAVLMRLGASRWKREKEALEAATWAATERCLTRPDAWGDDAFLDCWFVVLGRILGDAGRRTLPEAILRAYRYGTWPRFFRGRYPNGYILCVPFVE